MLGLVHLTNSKNDACDKFFNIFNLIKFIFYINYFQLFFFRMADFIIYKCNYGIISHFMVRRTIVKRMMFAENRHAYHYTPSYENFEVPFNKMVFKKLSISAISRISCSECF